MDKPLATELNPASLDIPAIRAMAEAATPGPWDFNQGEEGFEVGPSDWRAYQAAPFSEDDPHPSFVPNGFDVTNEVQREQLLRDEEFIAACRTAVHLLCDRIDEQAREIERLRNGISELATLYTAGADIERYLMELVASVEDAEEQ